MLFEKKIVKCRDCGQEYLDLVYREDLAREYPKQIFICRECLNNALLGLEQMRKRNAEKLQAEGGTK